MGVFGGVLWVGLVWVFSVCFLVFVCSGLRFFVVLLVGVFFLTKSYLQSFLSCPTQQITERESFPVP